MYFVLPKYSWSSHSVRRFLYIQNASGTVRIIVIPCPIENSVALETKNVERQFSLFLSERAVLALLA
jgi:hypothetical protein